MACTGKTVSKPYSRAHNLCLEKHRGQPCNYSTWSCNVQRLVLLLYQRFGRKPLTFRNYNNNVQRALHTIGSRRSSRKVGSEARRPRGHDSLIQHESSSSQPPCTTIATFQFARRVGDLKEGSLMNDCDLFSAMRQAGAPFLASLQRLLLLLFYPMNI